MFILFGDKLSYNSQEQKREAYGKGKRQFPILVIHRSKFGRTNLYTHSLLDA